MKLFLISDIHGAYQQANIVLNKFAGSKADYLVILGDILYHGPRNPLPPDYNPQALFPMLNTYSDKIIAVRGNCDSEVDQMVLDFNLSEDYNILALKDRLLYISHGHIYDPEKLPPGFGAGDIFAFGHIHIPLAEKQNDHYLINPGSIGLPKEDYPGTYALIDDSAVYIYDFHDHLVKSLTF